MKLNKGGVEKNKKKRRHVLIEHQIPRRFGRLVVPKPLFDIGQADAFQVLPDEPRVRPPLRRRPTDPERCDGAVLLGLLLSPRVPRRDLVHGFAELGLAEEEEARPAGHARGAVLRRLAGDVGEVDALWRRGWGVSWFFYFLARMDEER